jgi:hypothetical protein
MNADILHAGCTTQALSIHPGDMNIVTEHIVSPMTVTACVPGRRDSINMLQDKPLQHPIHPAAVRSIDTKKKSKKNTRSPSTYQLGYFTLWWGRMEREGKKEAEERRCKVEDQAASRGMKMFLGCSKSKKDGLKITRKDADETSFETLDVGDKNEMISGRTLEMASGINDMKDIKGAGGGKRLLEGGLDSPSKRARRFDDLKDFWGGRGGEECWLPSCTHPQGEHIGVYLHQQNRIMTRLIWGRQGDEL